MARKYLVVFLVVVMLFSLVVGCGKSKDAGTPSTPSDQPSNEPAAASFKVGMVTDAGTIDDKSFNQGTWEGILKAANEFGLETRYLKPSGTTEADYLREIGNLNDAGFKFIVTPGFKFETAIFQAQDRYTDAKFVLIDGSPNNGDWGNLVSKVGDNTVAIFFAEHESGFLAGVATALQLETGEVGYIGGMEIPPVQKFNWGFQQGLKYANENLGTNVTIKSENVIYQGSFDNVAAGQQLAGQMFDKGVRAIFVAAGSVGIGSIGEAKERMKAGKEAWIIGVDVDQYFEGIYEGDKSAILTSAMKYIDQAAYDMIELEKEGKFPGGQTLVFDAKNDGIGIPKQNPNLKPEVEAKVAEIFNQIKSGAIVVSDVQGDLIK